jgi:hypothetical protein
MPAENRPVPDNELAPPERGHNAYPLPTPGQPRLFDVKAYPSWKMHGYHLDMEATFPDYVFPEGATVKFFWDAAEGKAPKGQTLAPVLWCQAGQWRTPWRDGKPDLAALVCTDTEAPASRVRLEALHALHAIYAAAEERHAKILWTAHQAAADDLNAEVAARTKHMPPMSDQEVGDLLSDPAWWPPLSEGLRYRG